MNKVILIGNLARDPELRTTQGGISMCRFTVACNRRVLNAQGVREADFIPVIAWRERAEFVSRYFTKGRKIAVEGQIQVRAYEGPDGVKKYSTEVVADNVEFVDSNRQGGEGAASGGYTPSMPAAPQASAPYGAPPPSAPSYGAPPAAPARPAEPPRMEDFVAVDDDELPF